jgi:hypothetical protein
VLLFRVWVGHSLIDQHKLWHALKELQLMQLFWNFLRSQDDISITQKGVVINENKCHLDKIMMGLIPSYTVGILISVFLFS